VASCRYEEPLPEAIVGFKDRGIMSLRPLLGNVLAAGVMQALQIVAQSASPAQIPTLVPAASSPASVRARGFDHMWDLAQVAAQTCDVPARRTLRSGARADQAGLSFAARRRNVRATMRVREPGRGPVVIVDDVTTSGATLKECHRALTEGGFAVVAHVVIASSLTDPACAVTL
jgi:predicted amidophosphoribosyltransferase